MNFEFCSIICHLVVSTWATSCKFRCFPLVFKASLVYCNSICNFTSLVCFYYHIHRLFQQEQCMLLLYSSWQVQYLAVLRTDSCRHFKQEPSLLKSWLFVRGGCTDHGINNKFSLTIFVSINRWQLWNYAAKAKHSFIDFWYFCTKTLAILVTLERNFRILWIFLYN